VGRTTRGFDASLQHYAVDLATAQNEYVRSIASGTVLFADYTLTTGYILAVQHDNGLISIYKHNSQLLKQTGNRVQAGEPVAVVGNSGEQTTGPHLHFELWQQGVPLDPTQLIAFR
jgi:murein DD-endopeptidase MepM/ murein hydrolase activator NlpD